MATLTTNTAPEHIQSTAQGDNATAPTYMAIIFVCSLIVPILINAGPVLLMPHRIVLLIFFIPCAMRLLSGKAGKLIAADWLIFGSALWAALAMIYNHGVGFSVQPIGIHMIEFFGAYMLGRVAIRSAEDFRRFVKTMFWIVLFLLPFAALEAITKRNYLLEAIPNSIPVVHAPYRWGMRRAQTLFSHPIHYGVFCSFGMGLFWYVLRPAGRRFMSVPLVVASTIFSLSSGALICVVCQSVFIFWEAILKTIKARWRIFAAIFAAMFVFVELASNRGFFVLLTQYASFNTGSSYNRILIWRYGMENVYANPIFGLGFREWVRAHWMSTSADNFWLLNAMMFGVPSFFMFAGGVFNLLWRAARNALSDPLARACQAGFLTACGGVIIGGGTVHYWTAMMGLVLFLFGTGAWIGEKEVIIDGDDAETDPNQAQPINRYTRQARVLPAKSARIHASTPKPAAKAPYKRNPTLHERQKAMRERRAQIKPQQK